MLRLDVVGHILAPVEDCMRAGSGNGEWSRIGLLSSTINGVVAGAWPRGSISCSKSHLYCGGIPAISSDRPGKRCLRQRSGRVHTKLNRVGIGVVSCHVNAPVVNWMSAVAGNSKRSGVGLGWATINLVVRVCDSGRVIGSGQRYLYRAPVIDAATAL